MSVPFSPFTLRANRSAYSCVVTSCNPGVPVTFQTGNEAYDPTRVQGGGYLGGQYPSTSQVTAFCDNPVPTTWNENPIKLVVYEITSDQGVFRGNTAVFYGYYLEPRSGGLAFYLNQEQSQTNFQYGRSGIPSTIQMPQITLG
jgi:hypothetical protein